MSSPIQQEIGAAIRRAVSSLYGVEPPEFGMQYPPKPEMGDLACSVAFDLAKILKKNPRQTATELASAIELPEIVARCEPAGGGFVNFHLKRGLIPAVTRGSVLGEKLPAREGKVIVEHTNINPNKAAHIGHLRNAVLGDTLVRMLRYSGHEVEVQNYIDDTGVQVADLVVGFVHLRKMSLEDVRKVEDKIDYYCWDLYAEVNAWYAQDSTRERAKSMRGTTLKHMEEGIAPEGPMAAYLARRIVKCHLATMERINVSYDLLPWESHILGLKFWASAFEKLKASGAISLAEDGPKKGCWIMDMPEGEEGPAEEPKIIVRSNGTVTYVGKDIAYQLWKFGLLGSDFRYEPFHEHADGSVLWSTSTGEDSPDRPSFGAGTDVYNVIDVRQSYLQRVVSRGLRALGHDDLAEHAVHFAYEMVKLSPGCAKALGYEQEGDEPGKSLEMSGRRGYGVKADDLLDALFRAARTEVAQRADGMDADEIDAVAGKVSVAALRYFMIKFTRNKEISFDFDEVLSFEGETGPYILYSAVRASNILKKLEERHGVETGDPEVLFAGADWRVLESEPVDDHWELLALMSRFDDVVAQSVRGQEPATMARFLFVMAQKFNHFYHAFPVIREPDAGKRSARAALAWLFRSTMQKGCSLLGFEVPSRM